MSRGTELRPSESPSSEGNRLALLDIGKEENRVLAEFTGFSVDLGGVVFEVISGDETD